VSYEIINLSNQARKFLKKQDAKTVKKIYDAIQELTPENKLKLVGYDLYKKRVGGHSDYLQ